MKVKIQPPNVVVCLSGHFQTMQQSLVVGGWCGVGLWSGGTRSFHMSDADAIFSVFLMAKAHCHIVIFHALGASVHLSASDIWHWYLCTFC